MFAEERKQKILEYVREHKKATVQQLCDAYEVSSATIRNDLRELEGSGLLLRTHGGAIVKSKAKFELGTNEKKVLYKSEKAEIAEKALELIEDGDTIILDTGTTTLELAGKLGRRKNLTIVTNDLDTALVLDEIGIERVIMLGGILRNGFHCTLGNKAKEFLDELQVDKAFMGVNGFTFEKGASTPDLQHAEIKKAMVTAASQVYLMFDRSKLGRKAFARFAEPQEIDCVIIDEIAKEELSAFEDTGIEVHAVSVL
ncbi:MAG: DeoR/GlpR family DNA-binding transcription regulator [Spirochaetales bacterium]|uniref:DeoR/GlpR family DNA-binding transcription regulator n=1 Tax=Candidatus Thalassospirochaeta sargassi TaxID=3119039 RepID=A0AAJ1ILL2_9SPIO|nr:DeoR/GlpR family DNA-binding transcription regulator [Spirochaetales bacterium]